MALSVGEAAKAVGMTRQAIQAAIKKGTVSATKNAKGAWQVDPAELFRVYQPVGSQEVPKDSEDFTSLVTRQAAEIQELTAKLNAAHELLDVLKSQNADLKEQRDLWQVEARIWQQKTLPAAERRGFFARIFGTRS